MDNFKIHGQVIGDYRGYIESSMPSIGI